MTDLELPCHAISAQAGMVAEIAEGIRVRASRLSARAMRRHQEYCGISEKSLRELADSIRFAMALLETETDSLDSLFPADQS